jgi:hypothetical protein
MDEFLSSMGKAYVAILFTGVVAFVLLSLITVVDKSSITRQGFDGTMTEQGWATFKKEIDAKYGKYWEGGKCDDRGYWWKIPERLSLLELLQRSSSEIIWSSIKLGV